MKPFIQFKDFTFKYDIQAEPTLESLNLTIEKGQKVLIIGPSGSGKSTIGHCLNGIILIFTMGRNLGSLLLMVKKHLACLFTTSLIWFLRFYKTQMVNSLD